MAVGRLDINSEGLLLLTTSAIKEKAGGSGQRLSTDLSRACLWSHPSSMLVLPEGINIEGVQYGSILAEAEQDKAKANR